MSATYMYKLALIAAIAAHVEARFGQEQIPAPAIQELDGQFGNPGEASTLAGQVPGSLLGATDPCEKLQLADEIVATLGNDPAVIEAAAGLVAAEQNFNPDAVDVPNICGDATLPATEALRGIIPLVDPAVDGADEQNANSAQSLQTPFDADGLSVAEIMIANGFENLEIDGVANGGAGGAAGGDADAGEDDGNNDVDDGNNNVDDDNNNVDNDNDNDNNVDDGANQDDQDDDQEDHVDECVVVDDDDEDDDEHEEAEDEEDDEEQDQDEVIDEDAGAGAGNGTGNAGGADFGLCDPTIDLQFGRGDRDADEGTFAPVDDQIGGQEALNPNIITERVCDQLVNVCEANDAALDLCDEAAAEVEAAGTNGPEIVELFNGALGF